MMTRLSCGWVVAMADGEMYGYFRDQCAILSNQVPKTLHVTPQIFAGNSIRLMSDVETFSDVSDAFNWPSDVGFVSNSLP
jgi:hypothetical protein